MARNVQIVKISDITKFGDSLARSIRAHLKWSKKLRNKVRLHKGKVNGNGGEISITIADGDRNLQGMARAFEYGSGIHATRGAKKKYLIKPKNARALWFYMENPHPKIPLYIKGGKIGVVLPKVMHPGVEARPFISKAIQSTISKASADLAVSVRRNIVDELRIVLKDIK